jgi:ABC-type multidrug transport system fused ATPase/permease subunit
MVAVERAQEYANVPPESDILMITPPPPTVVGFIANKVEPDRSHLKQPLLSINHQEREDVDVEAAKTVVGKPLRSLDGWRPSSGNIFIDELTVQYPKTTRPALRSVSLHIRAAEHIGIVGRTGSGKSTLLAALWRLVPWQTGSIMIDGVDISSIPLSTLRGGLAIIPQHPLLFDGTVRFNLAPAGGYTDQQMLEALQLCGLADAPGAISSSAKHVTLNDVVEEGGVNWSVGERQLLCLARALLQKSAIVCLDEATASTDAGTDALIGKVLLASFLQATVIMVAHRVQTVLACDRIVVLKEGQVIESGEPAALMQRETSEFYSLARLADR